MAGGGPGNSSGGNVFQARLNTGLGGQSATLTLLPYKGNQILVGGRTVTVPSAGMTRLVTDHLITATGADSGAAGIASTLYYVYVSNPLATFSPSSIRLSATPPTLVNGVNYLGTSGNALNWRFVGWVQLNGTPQFESSLLNRLIVNYYNRQKLPMYVNPGYVDDNAPTVITMGNAILTALSVYVGSGVSRATFISNGEDAVSYAMTMPVSLGNGGVTIFGVGEDSATSAAVGTITSQGPGNANGSVVNATLFGVGTHFLEMLGAIFGAACSFYADIGRTGSAADVPGTVLSATVKG